MILLSSISLVFEAILEWACVRHGAFIRGECLMQSLHLRRKGAFIGYEAFIREWAFMRVIYGKHVAPTYGDLPRLTDRIAWRRLGIAGHCYRHRELPASQLVLWEPTHGWRKPGRPATTFLNILQGDIGATTSAELPASMKDRKDWNLRREARLRPP